MPNITRIIYLNLKLIDWRFSQIAQHRSGHLQAYKKPKITSEKWNDFFSNKSRTNQWSLWFDVMVWAKISKPRISELVNCNGLIFIITSFLHFLYLCFVTHDFYFTCVPLYQRLFLVLVHQYSVLQSLAWRSIQEWLTWPKDNYYIKKKNFLSIAPSDATTSFRKVCKQWWWSHTWGWTTENSVGGKHRYSQPGYRWVNIM